VTWVLDGALVHQDSQGHSGIITPGLAQRMSAGSGILHSEKNDAWRIDGRPAHDDPVHFIQMWVVPDDTGDAPGYEQLDVTDELTAGGLVPVASGRAGHESAIRIRQKDATLHAGRPQAGDTLVLPDAPFVHLFVARGSVELEGAGRLAAGDAARITGSQGGRVQAVDAGTEILVWEMHSALR